MVHDTSVTPRKQKITTPRAAALAGIISGSLFIISHLLLRYTILINQTESGTWVVENANMVSLALHLVPFAGIAFLWFIGVARDRLGQHEDQFFATVFLGSGLLYLATDFIATAIAGGLLISYPHLDPNQGDSILIFAQMTIVQIADVYSVRMAAVFMISAATLWFRTQVMPRWLVLLTYVLGLVLLVLVNLSTWVTLIFPIWILGVSLLILIFNYRHTSEHRNEHNIVASE